MEEHTLPVARLLQLAATASLGSRMTALFLGGQYPAAEFMLPLAIARLMMQCLERYVAEAGGSILHTTCFDDDPAAGQEVPAIFHTINVGSESYQVLDVGAVFMQVTNVKMVLHVAAKHYGGGENISRLHIHSSGDGQQFYSQWRKFTRSHHYLLGISAYADGTPIVGKRQYTWDDIVLDERAAKMLKLQVITFLEQLPALRAAGMKPRRGLILSGPPGTGKTLVGKVLASTVGVTFIWVLPRHIRNIQHIERILQLARFVSPAVLFFEDLDLIGEDREGGTSAVLGELMNQLDGVADNNGLVTIATTNRLEVVEKALRNRPGRFDRVIAINPPKKAGRLQLLRKLMSKMEAGERMLDQLAHSTDGMSPAQIEEVVNTLILMSAGEGGCKLTGNAVEMAVAEVGGCRKGGMGFREKER